MSDPTEEAAPSEPAAADDAEERPRKRKRRRAEAEPPEREAAEAPPAPERPAFALGFPREPALDALVAAFEAGDYARVRREAPALARDAEQADVRAAARELLRRLDPDPLAKMLLGMAALLLVFLAGWYWLHPHAR